MITARVKFLNKRNNHKYHVDFVGNDLKSAMINLMRYFSDIVDPVEVVYKDDGKVILVHRFVPAIKSKQNKKNKRS